TLQYMSPEQLQGKPADARSDLFSFGCVLYEMLAGKPAFQGLERELAPLEMSPPLARVIRTCLAKDPDQRFQTAVDLERNPAWAMEQPVASAKPSRRWWVATAAALVTAMLIGWVGFRFRPPAIEQPPVRLSINPPDGGQFVFGTNQGGIALSPDGRTAAFVA